MYKFCGLPIGLSIPPRLLAMFCIMNVKAKYFRLLVYFRTINESGKKVLAGLLVNLFSPCYAIASLSTQLSIEKINQYLVSNFRELRLYPSNDS